MTEVTSKLFFGTPGSCQSPDRAFPLVLIYKWNVCISQEESHVFTVCVDEETTSSLTSRLSHKEDCSLVSFDPKTFPLVSIGFSSEFLLTNFFLPSLGCFF